MGPFVRMFFPASSFMSAYETILLKTQNLYSQSVMLRGFEGIYKAVKVASILVLV